MKLSDLRHDWDGEEVLALFGAPFNDLLFRAQELHRRHFEANRVQLSTLLSIKTGGCPEDCAYCPQSARYHTGVKAEPLMDLDTVTAAARAAKAKDRYIESVAVMVREVRALGLETCLTLGMLKPEQAQRLSDAGLDYYNHNLDTSESYYKEIITTREYGDRLDTLHNVRAAGIKVCCGGIVGMGESRRDRAELLRTLANLPQHPESVPINNLVQVEGTPLKGLPQLDPLEFVRTIAMARVLMPMAYVRLSAGRSEMSDELQALCFLAGANSIFYGEKLLTTGNPQHERDRALFERLGIRPEDTPPPDPLPQGEGEKMLS